jgi:hypothetical protein
MSLSPVQAANRAAHRARLVVESRRAAAAATDVQQLLARRDLCRQFLRSKQQAITVLEDEVFDQVVQISDINRRLCGLGYAGV